MTNPPVSSPPPPVSPSSPPPKKGTNVWVWVGVGCLVVVLLGLGTCYACGVFVKNKVEKFADNPAMSAAKLIVQANPELELVSTDDAAGTLTIRKKETGETITVNLSEIQEGKFSFTDDKGETAAINLGAGESAKGLPDWIPVYPGASMRQMFSTSGQDGRSGSYMLTSIDTIDAVADFYERRFTAAGFITKRSSAAMGGAVSTTSVNAEDADEGRTVNVGLTDLGGNTQALITFSEKN